VAVREAAMAEVSPPHRFRWPARLALALVIGVLAGLATNRQMDVDSRALGYDKLGGDFTYWWRAAIAVEQRVSPYKMIRAAGKRFQCCFFYPLPAALVTMPFTSLTPRMGAAVFVGIGFAVAAFALSSLATWRLIALASAPALIVFANGQWAPLLLGAAILPGLGWLLAIKPTLGAALWIWRPRWETIIGGALVCLLALIVLPSWPLEYLAVMKEGATVGQYHPPFLMVNGAGIPLLLVFLRWRRPEGRLLAAMACIPQNAFFYDQLPLVLVPASRQGLLAFGLWSNVVWIAARVLRPRWQYDGIADASHAWEPFVLFGFYLPCLMMVLLRKNEGAMPAWIERAVARIRPRRLPETRTTGD
jgi:hypothetical protein